MSLEFIFWGAFKITISFFVGWILGNLYARSKMKSKKKRRLSTGRDGHPYRAR